jgi:hypothetical protein
MSGIVTRGAVVIGVNRTGGLSPLRAAVSGAEQVGAWLTSEGFAVKMCVDTAGPVEGYRRIWWMRREAAYPW